MTERFPPDAPVVPNDRWRDLDAGPVPRRCTLFHRRHFWLKPDPALARYVCGRCETVTYTVPSAKFRP